MHWSLAAINVSVRRVRHGWKGKLVHEWLPSLSHSYHHGAASVLDSVATSAPVTLANIQRNCLHAYNIFPCFFGSIVDVSVNFYAFIGLLDVFLLHYMCHILLCVSCVSLHWLQPVTFYREGNQVHAHIITIRIKTVTNTVIVLNDTVTTFVLPTNNWTNDFLWAATTRWRSITPWSRIFHPLQFGADNSSPAFSTPAFSMVQIIPVSHFQSPCLYKWSRYSSRWHSWWLQCVLTGWLELLSHGLKSGFGWWSLWAAQRAYCGIKFLCTRKSVIGDSSQSQSRLTVV